MIEVTASMINTVSWKINLTQWKAWKENSSHVINMYIGGLLIEMGIGTKISPNWAFNTANGFQGFKKLNGLTNDTFKTMFIKKCKKQKWDITFPGFWEAIDGAKIWEAMSYVFCFLSFLFDFLFFRCDFLFVLCDFLFFLFDFLFFMFDFLFFMFDFLFFMFEQKK